jgi:hypothetical protein
MRRRAVMPVSLLDLYQACKTRRNKNPSSKVALPSDLPSTPPFQAKIRIPKAHNHHQTL